MLQDWATAKLLKKRQNEEIRLQIVHKNPQNLEFSSYPHFAQTVQNCLVLPEKPHFANFKQIHQKLQLHALWATNATVGQSQRETC